MVLKSVVIDEDAQTLTIVLGLEKKPKLSSSGKTRIVADSGGSVLAIPANSINGKSITVSAVAWIAK